MFVLCIDYFPGGIRCRMPFAILHDHNFMSLCEGAPSFIPTNISNSTTHCKQDISKPINQIKLNTTNTPNMNTTTFATAATSDEELAVEESIAALTTGGIDFDNLDSAEDLPSHNTKDELMGDINQIEGGVGATNMGNNG